MKNKQLKMLILLLTSSTLIGCNNEPPLEPTVDNSIVESFEESLKEQTGFGDVDLQTGLDSLMNIAGSMGANVNSNSNQEFKLDKRHGYFTLGELINREVRMDEQFYFDAYGNPYVHISGYDNSYKTVDEFYLNGDVFIRLDETGTKIVKDKGLLGCAGLSKDIIDLLNLSDIAYTGKLERNPYYISEKSLSKRKKVKDLESLSGMNLKDVLDTYKVEIGKCGMELEDGGMNHPSDMYYKMKVYYNNKDFIFANVELDVSKTDTYTTYGTGYVPYMKPENYSIKNIWEVNTVTEEVSECCHMSDGVWYVDSSYDSHTLEGFKGLSLSDLKDKYDFSYSKSNGTFNQK